MISFLTEDDNTLLKTLRRRILFLKSMRGN